MKFTIHSKTTAPEGSRATLEATEKAIGFIPNLFGVLAESPAALDSYAAINHALMKSGLNKIEQQVVAITVSTENNCPYCVAAHSALAHMVKMPDEIIAGLRDRQSLPDPKLDALRSFVLAVLNNRGWAPEKEIEAFLNAGYSPQHILDVITIVAMKTLSNYVNHIAETPLDDRFASQRWSKA
jgi:uncharacterized peroxidase-related enzyme